MVPYRKSPQWQICERFPLRHFLNNYEAWYERLHLETRNAVRVQWNCTPQHAVLAVTPGSFAAGGNCPAGQTRGWTCTTTVGEAADTSGVLAWSASSALPGVGSAPASIALRPGGKATLATNSIPPGACTPGTFTFAAERDGGQYGRRDEIKNCSMNVKGKPLSIQETEGVESRQCENV